MGGTYTTKGEGISVGWQERLPQADKNGTLGSPDSPMAERFGGRPVVVVSYWFSPSGNVEILKPYATADEAKAAAKAFAAKANELAPNGLWTFAVKPEHLADLAKLDAYATEWAGPEAIVKRYD